MRQAQKVIEQHGVVVKDKYGQLKPNPATNCERDSEPRCWRCVQTIESRYRAVAAVRTFRPASWRKPACRRSASACPVPAADIEPWLSARLKRPAVAGGLDRWAKRMYECALPDELLPEWRNRRRDHTAMGSGASRNAPVALVDLDSPEPRQRLTGRVRRAISAWRMLRSARAGCASSPIGDDTISVSVDRHGSQRPALRRERAAGLREPVD